MSLIFVDVLRGNALLYGQVKIQQTKQTPYISDIAIKHTVGSKQARGIIEKYK